MTEIKHYGILRRSGRYPWGSGMKYYQGLKTFREHILELRAKGVSDADIAKSLNISLKKLRDRMTDTKVAIKYADIAMAERLFARGWSKTAIAERMGYNESYIRSLLAPGEKERNMIFVNTVNTIKQAVDERNYIDVGLGTAAQLGITRTKLDAAVSALEDHGYPVFPEVRVRQVGNDLYTIYKVIAQPGTTKEEVFEHKYDIDLVRAYTQDGGRTFRGIEPPTSVDSKRIMVRYGSEGALKDGVIELRPGVQDLTLEGKRYAQVRVLVDGTHYMKGMAIYAYGPLPEGVDIVYNSNKPAGSSKDDVFKPVHGEENPFKTTIRQVHYKDSNGVERLSPLNRVGHPNKPESGEEGAWSRWSKTISSQIMSKQSPDLAKRQLGLALQEKLDDYDEIMNLTNPALKKFLLEDFAKTCDKEAVDLKAAALPRQANQVLLPLTSIKPDQVFAPNFNNGESVVLIRHPHGGTFEIPQLIVNNNVPEGVAVYKRSARDMVGVHPDVAKRLSGADFDGDTVIVIPNDDKHIRTSSPIKSIVDFDPKTAYPAPPGLPRLSEGASNLKMGDVSNLITDMTIMGASSSEIARAVRHSMVIIDCKKHDINWPQSYSDNGIADLKKRYQGGARRGAATIVSRASSEERVPHRREGIVIVNPETGKSRRVMFDPVTGKKLYEPTGQTYVNKDGIRVPRTTISTKMAEREDARELSSGTRIENIYADHANGLKELGNRARVSLANTPNLEYSPSARKTYSREVAELKAALTDVYENKPRERQALLIARKNIATRYKEGPLMSKAEAKKMRGQAIIEGRHRAHAQKKSIPISDRQWEAIQAGAVSHNILMNILRNTDTKTLRQRAVPRYRTGISPAKLLRARAMLNAGHTQAEIARILGYPISTLMDAIDAG